MKRGNITAWILQNKWFVVLFIIALVIRLYYFSLTLDQPMWWDEAEYFAIAKNVFFGFEYKIPAARPILFPVILGLTLLIDSATEVLPRLIILLFSLASVFFMYLLAKAFFKNKNYALIPAFFMAVLPMNLFFTNRIQVDVPSLALFILAAFLFYKAVTTNDKKYWYYSFFAAGLGTLIKPTTAIILIVMLAYLLFTEKLSFLKRKEFWIGAGIYFLTILPYIIWGYFEFGGFVFTKASVHSETPIQAFISNIPQHISFMPLNLSWLLVILFIIGLFCLYPLFLGFDLILKNKEGSPKNELFLFLLFLIPLLLISFMFPHAENRWGITLYPAIFLISTIPLIKLHKFAQEKQKQTWYLFLIAIFIIAVAFLQIQTTEGMIKSKIDSYAQVKQAGLWINVYSDEDDIVVTGSAPQIAHYSNRKVISYGHNETEFLEIIDRENPRYLIVSGFEYHPPWLYEFPAKHNTTLRPVQAYSVEANPQQPVLVIYEFI